MLDQGFKQVDGKGSVWICKCMLALFACCRLRAGARADESDSQTSRRTEPYTSMQEFSDELDKFGSFYKLLRKDPNESEEASIMRLAETLSGNASVLKVRSCLFGVSTATSV